VCYCHTTSPKRRVAGRLRQHVPLPVEERNSVARPNAHRGLYVLMDVHHTLALQVLVIRWVDQNPKFDSYDPSRSLDMWNVSCVKILREKNVTRSPHGKRRIADC
jgi:hypothetical protein